MTFKKKMNIGPHAFSGTDIESTLVNGHKPFPNKKPPESSQL